MKKQHLYMGIALSALLAGAPAAFAQTAINQSAINNEDVGNWGTITTSGGNAGIGASLSVSASGAVASTAVTGLNQNFTFPSDGTTTGFSTIDQTATNDGDVRNAGRIVGDTVLQGIASSASISASGAVAAVSVLGAGQLDFTFPSGAVNFAGAITQGNGGSPVSNYGTVTNRGKMDVGNLAGDGTSASIGASGAVASVDVTYIGLTPAPPFLFDPSTFVSVSQNVHNGGDVRDKGVMNIGDLLGDGASASISATGAQASLTLASIDARTSAPNLSTFTGTGTVVSQAVENDGDVFNKGSITLGAISGNGASASIGASGATASISVVGINTDYTNTPPVPGVNFGGSNTIYQSAINSGTIINRGDITQTAGGAGLTGIGSSALINASGAATVFSVSSIAETNPTSPTIVGAIQQTATSTGPVYNSGSITLNNGGLANGASAAITANGAIADVSFRTVK